MLLYHLIIIFGLCGFRILLYQRMHFMIWKFPHTTSFPSLTQQNVKHNAFLLCPFPYFPLSTQFLKILFYFILFIPFFCYFLFADFHYFFISFQIIFLNNCTIETNFIFIFNYYYVFIFIWLQENYTIGWRNPNNYTFDQNNGFCFYVLGIK